MQPTGTVPGAPANVRPGELPGHAASLKPGMTVNGSQPNGHYATEMANLNVAPMSDGSPPGVTTPRRRPSRRPSQQLNSVAVPIPEHGYPEINHAEDEVLACSILLSTLPTCPNTRSYHSSCTAE